MIHKQHYYCLVTDLDMLREYNTTVVLAVKIIVCLSQISHGTRIPQNKRGVRVLYCNSSDR